MSKKKQAADQSTNARRKLALQCYETLEEEFPDVEPTLNYSTAWELLVGGILGAQTTDVRVNKITDRLFHDFPEIADYSKASQEEIESYIKTAGLFRNKAKALRGAASMIVEEFYGQVPADREKLMALPGVGRKVANLVLGDYYRIPAMVVDTHNARISKRLGLTDSNNPTIVERDLVDLLPDRYWIRWGHLMVNFGREICRSRAPLCESCCLKDVCRYNRENKGS